MYFNLVKGGYMKNLILTILILVPSFLFAISPEEALKRLLDGNKRFLEGKSIHPNQTLARIKETAKGQTPFAVIVGCSDSRVPNEIIFDQGLGDLFIVRTAGQVSTYASWGSIEFAVEALKTNLILVLGHTKCGAVAAACKLPDVSGNIITLINAIKPASEIAKDMKGDHVDNAVKVNVALEVKSLRNLEPILSKKYFKKQIKIIGGVYDIETGKIELLSEEFISQIKGGF